MRFFDLAEVNITFAFTVHLCLNLSLSMWILLQNNTVERPPPLLLWVLACVWLIKRLCAVSLWPSVMLCRGAWSPLTHSQTNEPLGENEIWCKCGCCYISCTPCQPGSKAKMNTDTQVASHESVYWTDAAQNWAIQAGREGKCVGEHRLEGGVTHFSVGMSGASLKCSNWTKELSDMEPNIVHLVVFTSSSLQEDAACLMSV